MASTEAAPARVKRVPPWLVGLGILVIAIGFGAPQLVPSSSSPSAISTSNSSTPNIGQVKLIDGPPVGLSLLKMIGSLILVSGLCIVVARFVNNRQKPETGNMTVLAALGLGQRCTLQFVKAGDRKLIIGIDATGVKAILELPRVVEENPTPEIPSTDSRQNDGSDLPVVVGPIVQRISEPTLVEIEDLVARYRSAVPSQDDGSRSELISLTEEGS